MLAPTRNKSASGALVCMWLFWGVFDSHTWINVADTGSRSQRNKQRDAGDYLQINSEFFGVLVTPACL